MVWREDEVVGGWMKRVDDRVGWERGLSWVDEGGRDRGEGMGGKVGVVKEMGWVVGDDDVVRMDVVVGKVLKVNMVEVGERGMEGDIRVVDRVDVDRVDEVG